MTEDHPVLEPCPFCGSTPVFQGAWAHHPEADCLMTDEHLFAWTMPDLVRRWNSRAQGGAA